MANLAFCSLTDTRFDIMPFNIVSNVSKERKSAFQIIQWMNLTFLKET